GMIAEKTAATTIRMNQTRLSRTNSSTGRRRVASVAGGRAVVSVMRGSSVARTILAPPHPVPLPRGERERGARSRPQLARAPTSPRRGRGRREAPGEGLPHPTGLLLDRRDRVGRRRHVAPEPGIVDV